jgi:hypothetical protein
MSNLLRVDLIESLFYITILYFDSQTRLFIFFCFKFILGIYFLTDQGIVNKGAVINLFEYLIGGQFM